MKLNVSTTQISNLLTKLPLNKHYNLSIYRSKAKKALANSHAFIIKASILIMKLF